jgi:hypothetical protein
MFATPALVTPLLGMKMEHDRNVNNFDFTLLFLEETSPATRTYYLLVEHQEGNADEDAHNNCLSPSMPPPLISKGTKNDDDHLNMSLLLAETFPVAATSPFSPSLTHVTCNRGSQKQL